MLMERGRCLSAEADVTIPQTWGRSDRRFPLSPGGWSWGSKCQQGGALGATSDLQAAAVHHVLSGLRPPHPVSSAGPEWVWTVSPPPARTLAPSWGPVSGYGHMGAWASAWGPGHSALTTGMQVSSPWNRLPAGGGAGPRLTSAAPTVSPGLSLSSTPPPSSFRAGQGV